MGNKPSTINNDNGVDNYVDNVDNIYVDNDNIDNNYVMHNADICTMQGSFDFNTKGIS